MHFGGSGQQRPRDEDQVVMERRGAKREEVLAEAKLEAELAAVRRQDRLAEARAEVEVQRTLREGEEKERERIGQEETVRRWRNEQNRRWRERRDARRRFFSGLLKGWRRRQDSLQGQAGTLRVLTVLGVPASVALLVYAIPNTAEVLGVGLLVAAASFTVGALFGFLFGIPRSVQPHAPKEAGQEMGEPVAEAAANAQRFAPNTNLEQISDWLTKILVGVGLVQLHQAGDALDDLADGLAPGLGARGHAAAIALMVSFSITGFVGAYLFTRLRLQSAFELATAIREAFKQRADTETSAIALVHKQLDPVGDGGPPLAALTEALQAATQGVRSQAFYLAREQRRSNWRAGDRHLVTLAVPVFEALIACDTANRYHRNHGELGYALKDQAEPDYRRSKEELLKAISIRPRGQEKRFWPYEFNLACCEIELDAEGFKAHRPTASPLAAAIATQLLVPAQVESGRKAITGSEAESEEERARNPVPRWLAINSPRPELRDLEALLPPSLTR
jgi:hypothetical protein